jgi:hypothetical protein
MENFFENDSSFEVQSNLDGEYLLNNRVLTTYPSEKSSFQVFLGGDGSYSFQGTDADKKASTAEAPQKRTIDPEKLSGAITAGVGAVGAVASTVQAFKGDGTKTPSRRKQLKEVCGRRPILARKRESTGYNKCVASYNANLLGGTRSTTTQNDTSLSSEAELKAIADAEKKARNTKIIIGSLIVVAVGVTAFIAFKKGWFSSK